MEKQAENNNTQASSIKFGDKNVNRFYQASFLALNDPYSNWLDGGYYYKAQDDVTRFSFLENVTFIARNTLKIPVRLSLKDINLFDLMPANKNAHDALFKDIFIQFDFNDIFTLMNSDRNRVVVCSKSAKNPGMYQFTFCKNAGTHYDIQVNAENLEKEFRRVILQGYITPLPRDVAEKLLCSKIKAEV